MKNQKTKTDWIIFRSKSKTGEMVVKGLKVTGETVSHYVERR
jgi:hypothetical protein